MKSLRRFTDHKPVGSPLTLSASHPAVVDGRSLFRRSANADRASGRVLISGINSRKIGSRCLKGKWKGMPIYTLTLEERKTCPPDCEMWRSCYGNKMQWSIRHPEGPELEAKLEREIAELSRRHPLGFIVRLHVLGDFYSVAYVKLWAKWLKRFPALHVFGYTARHRDDIAVVLSKLITTSWDRFAVRSSGGKLHGVPMSTVVDDEAHARDVVCPAQTGRTECCGTCGLCWNSRKPIVFVEH